MRSGSYVVPDLCVAYNAGIWGYESWDCTVKLMKGVTFLVTSYTVEEGEDDYERVKELRGGEGGCVLEPEENFYGSGEERRTESKKEGRVYKENKCWQIWRF